METPFEEKKDQFWKMALNNALLISAALIVMSLVFYLINDYTNKLQTWIGLAIFLTGLIYGLISYRDQSQGGFIKYGKSLGFSLITGLFTGLITAFFTFIFLSFIAPDVLESMREDIIVNIENTVYESNPNVSDSEMDMILKMALIATRPWFLAMMSIISYVFYGLLFGLIVSIFIKKEDPQELPSA